MNGALSAERSAATTNSRSASVVGRSEIGGAAFIVMIVPQRYRIGPDMNRFRLSKDRPAQMEPLYARLAGALETQIRSGALQIGDRVASVRALSREQGVSVATVLQAIARLESQGFVEARPRSGYYVRT